MEIATGNAESHPTPLPYDSGQSSGVAAETPRSPGFSGPSAGLEGGVRDLTGERLVDLAGIEADCRAAQAAGMDARNTMLGHYQTQAIPLGGQIGNAVDLPVVAENAVPPPQSFLHPFSGDEPTEASAGMAGPYPSGG